MADFSTLPSGAIAPALQQTGDDNEVGPNGLDDGLSHDFDEQAPEKCSLKARMLRIPANAKPPDQSRIIASLAHDARMPIATVTGLYQKEIVELARTARLATFVPIFAIRNVREALLARGITQAVPQKSKGHLATVQDRRTAALA